MELFVTCPEGIEPLLINELTKMGLLDLTVGFRGVYVANASMEAIYRINYCSRLASRVLLPLARFRCYDAKSLYKGVATVDWLNYIHKGQTFAIDANVSHRMIRNSMFGAQVAKDAICDQYRERTGDRPNVDPKDPDVLLNLFIHNEHATINFDTSGGPLHKRGYRLDSVEAPLQESMAAALLTLMQYKGDEIACDPCCGSGTLLIEAALMASQTAPGYLRKNWGFMTLREFNQIEWLKVKNEVDKLRKPIPKGHLFGCDVNKDAVRICKTNLRGAGFHQEAEIVHSDFREYTPPVLPNLIFCNPPHGIRMDDTEHLRPVYRALGDFLKRKSATPAKGFIFTGNLELAKEVGLSPNRRHVIMNGGVESRLLEFDLY